MIPQCPKIVSSLLAALVMTPAWANDIPHLLCFQAAAERYDIDIRILLAIAKVESGLDMNKVNKNDNGSTDHGIMQINSSWQEELAAAGIRWKDVVQLPCMNIHVGAWVLANNFSQKGMSWYSVGAYNAGFKNTNAARSHRALYVLKVYGAAKSLSFNTIQSARQRDDGESTGM